MEIIARMKGNGFQPHYTVYSSWANSCMKRKDLESTHDLMTQLNMKNNGNEIPPIKINGHLKKKIAYSLLRSGDFETATALVIESDSNSFQLDENAFKFFIAHCNNSEEMDTIIALMMVNRMDWTPDIWSSIISCCKRIKMDPQLIDDLSVHSFSKGFEYQYSMLRSGAIFAGILSSSAETILFESILRNKTVGQKSLAHSIRNIVKKESKSADPLIQFWNTARHELLFSYPSKKIYRELIFGASKMRRFLSYSKIYGLSSETKMGYFN